MENSTPPTASGSQAGELEPIPEEASPTSRVSEPPASLQLSSSKALKPSAKNSYRLVVLGASKVGKSSIVSRFLTNKFQDDYTPTIEDFHRKLYRIRGDPYQLDILDSSGNYPFPAMKRLAILTGDIFIIAFSLSDRDTWHEALKLRREIIQTKESITASNSALWKKMVGGNNRTPNRIPPMVFAGNKSDREDRCIPTQEVQSLVGGLPSCTYVETSAKKNHNVDRLFYELFHLSEMPVEMTPACHKHVFPPPVGPNNPTVGPSRESSRGVWMRGLSLRRRLSEAAYGMVTPDARRPSIRTDLLILRAKTSLNLTENINKEKRPRREVSCVIQ